MTISKKEKWSMKRILFSQSNVFNEFIRWFNEFRNYESMIFFREIEFVYLFLFTVNVNVNIQFHRFVVSKYWWDHLMSRSFVRNFMCKSTKQKSVWKTQDASKSIWCEFVQFQQKNKKASVYRWKRCMSPNIKLPKNAHHSLFVLDYQNAKSTPPFKSHKL